MAVLTRWEPYGQMRGRIDFLVNGGPARVVVKKDQIFYTETEGGTIEPVPQAVLNTHGDFLMRIQSDVS